MVLFLPSADPQPLGVGLHRTDAFQRQPLFAVHPGDSSGSPVVVLELAYVGAWCASGTMRQRRPTDGSVACPGRTTC
jgi:hypothetical protein